jgi:hypothetical protein
MHRIPIPHQIGQALPFIAQAIGAASVAASAACSFKAASARLLQPQLQVHWNLSRSVLQLGYAPDQARHAVHVEPVV